MAEGKTSNQSFELNDAAVLAELRADSASVYWHLCREYVHYLVKTRYPSLRPQVQEEVVQESVLRIHQHLASFQGRSLFTTWVGRIVYNCGIDLLRHQQHTTDREDSIDELNEAREEGGESMFASGERTPEEVALTQECLRAAFLATVEYVQTHGKARRNGQIVFWVLLHGYSQEQVAIMLDVPAPVVGYVVRSARAYIRQSLTQQGLL